ncbi:MAG: carboxy terminal-processing peptidase, partial [Gammaproteobacteria bacterium]|nr:carboxy terminal-processing peptidase [Gammaproteobacteria bacterium]
LAQERAEKSVPLWLAAREVQRMDRDRQSLVLANDWRKLKGLPPATTLEAAYKLADTEAAKTSPKTDADDDADNSGPLVPDVLLQETAHIVTDMAALGVGSLPPQAA